MVHTMVYIMYIMVARSYHGTRAGKTPSGNFTFFAKNLENRQYLTFFDILYPCLMDLGSETYLEFEIWISAFRFSKFRLKTSSWRKVMT